MATPFEQLAKQAPVLDSEAERRAKEAKRIQLQQQLAQAQPAPGMSATRAAQAVSPQAALEQGGAALGARQAGMQQQVQIGQAGLQQQAQQAGVQQAQAELAQREDLSGQAVQQQLSEADAERRQKLNFTKEELAQQKRLQQFGIDYNNQASFLTRKQREDLSKLGTDVKQELFDKRLAFEKSERGRKFGNERQLADFAVVSARNAEELQGRMQAMEQAAQFELIMLQSAHRRLVQDMKQNWESMDADKRREYQEALQTLESSFNAQKQKIETTSANKEMIVKGGAMVGGVIGAIYGGPVGAAVGSAAGGAIGAGAAESGAAG